MKCPTCKETNLVISERQGIEIDYCPDCRGVWLDRGELDKILERSHTLSAAPPSNTQAPPQPQVFQQNPGYQHHPQQGGYQQGPYQQGPYQKPYKRKKSFLEEIFD